MGGCRCSYRNCTVRTDGKTHMFHYPVFEKVRCHQWLVNAQRLDFLNLKVSQLKNRVICQHHFREECFMNYKKDKLTFEAIPTENGPFCDASKFKNQSKEIVKAYSNVILLEDIENEIFNDKKANYSIKYGDFLTNGELTDSSSRFNYDITLSNSLTNSKLDQNNKTDIFKPCLTRLSLPSKSINKSPPQPMLVVPPYTDISNHLNAGNEINQDLGVTNTVPSNDINLKQNNNQHSDFQNSVVKKEPKVKILSAKKIQLQSPLPVVGEFKKVSPSTTLHLPNKSNINIEGSKNIINFIESTNSKDQLFQPVTVISQEVDIKPSNKLEILEVLNVQFDNTSNNKANETNTDVVKTEVVDRVNESIEIAQIQSSPKLQKLKPKVTPERSAIIKRKRKFNMRMKDVLESCLNKLDDPARSKEKSLLKPVVKEKNSIISCHLAKDQNLPNIQEYTLAYLDASMKKMERTLLNKIEQNSQRILELKDTVGDTKKKKEANRRKYVNAQTNTSEECYKKYLYKEISQFLSESSCSLIYEELFVNKFTLDQQADPQRRKRRKCV